MKADINTLLLYLKKTDTVRIRINSGELSECFMQISVYKREMFINKDGYDSYSEPIVFIFSNNSGLNGHWDRIIKPECFCGFTCAYAEFARNLGGKIPLEFDIETDTMTLYDLL